jgi:hypothetical protein
MMKKTSYKHYIEILPAAYLSQRRTWQPVAQSLPVGGCLLVTNPENKTQTRMMQTVIQAFRKRGKLVRVWPVR